MKKHDAKAHAYGCFVLSVFCLLLLLVSPIAYGAETGTIKGRITDKADGEGVFGASVSVVGTTIGTATDMNGNFTLRGVPAKQQKLSVSIVGYATSSQMVNVGAGETAVANIAIGQTTIMASEVVVGAALYRQDRLDVPVSSSVVSKEKIHEKPNASLDQVVESVPGVVVSRAGGQATSTLQIRGSNPFQGGGIGTRVQSLYDGFPVNAPESGEIVWPAINMNAADKVEVLKGAAATLYGSGAMGGVVNVFGHLPDTFEVKAGASGGFYDKTPAGDNSLYRDGFTPWFWSTYIGVGNRSGKWTYSLLYSHSDDEGYRKNTDMTMNDVKLKVKYAVDSRQYLLLSAMYNETTGGYGFIWPFDVAFSAGGPIFTPHPELAYDGSSDVFNDDLIKRKNALAGLSYVNMLRDNLTLDARLYYTYNGSRIEYNHTDANETYPPFGRIRTPGEFNETYSNRYGAGVKMDWKANDRHRFVFGLDGNIVDVSTTQVAAKFPVKNTFHDIQEKNLAAFLQDEWYLTERLTALVSLRYDWSGIDADRAELAPGGPEIELRNKTVDALSPRVALNYKVMDDMSMRASWGRSFRAPTLYERFIRDGGIFMGIPNPSLDKETMTAYEIGVYKQFGDKVSLDVAGFVNDYDDLIQGTITGTRLQYSNVTKARIWGVETNLDIRPDPHWNINLAYTYLNAKTRAYRRGENPSLDRNPDPEWLPYRPEHTASASVSWKPLDSFVVNLTGRYIGPYKATTIYTNPEGSNYPGDFVVFDLGLKYRLSETIGGTLLCRNIGNVQYEEAEWIRAPGRSFLVSIDFTY